MGQGAVQLASVQRTKTLALSDDLEKRLNAGAAEPQDVEESADPKAETQETANPTAETQANVKTVLDESSPSSTIEPTLHDEPATDWAETNRASSPRSTAPSNPPSWRSAPHLSARDSSPPASRDSRAGPPWQSTQDPVEIPTESRSHWALVALCFGAGVLVVLLAAFKFGVFRNPEPKVGEFAKRAEAAAAQGAWDSPPGANVRDITDAALRQWPAAPAIVRVRKDAAKKLVTQAKLAAKDAEKQRWLSLAAELDPENAEARKLLGKLASQPLPEASAQPPPAKSSPSAHAAKGKSLRSTPKKPGPPKKPVAKPETSASSAPTPTSAPSAGGRWL